MNNYITFETLGEIGNTCSQIQQYASLYSIAKKKGKTIVLTESCVNNIYKHSTGSSPGLKFMNLLDIDIPIVSDDISFIDIPVDINRIVDYNVFNLTTDINYNITGRFDSFHYWYDDTDVRQAISDINLKPSLITTANNKLDEIKNKHNNKITVSMHIRRGDYLLPQHNHYAKLDIQYYSTAINEYFEDTDNYVFLIFSDDIVYCKEHLIEGENVEYMENNSEYMDMALMSLCDNNIIANSSFSWWSAYLNKNTDKIIVCPYNYVKSNSFASHLNGNYYPQEWNAIFNS